MMPQRTEFWRSIIRIFAITAALLGLVLIANEVVENISSCNAGACVRIHLVTMLWGITLLSLGLLILQKGDVSMSLRDMTATGNAVATWLGRRAYDRKSGNVAVVTRTEETAVVVGPESSAPSAPIGPMTPAPIDIPIRRDD